MYKRQNLTPAINAATSNGNIVDALNFVHSLVTGETVAAVNLSVSGTSSFTGPATFAGSASFSGSITSAAITSSAEIVATGFRAVGGGLCFHPGNNGTGAGIDAELFGGQPVSAYALANHTHSASNITSGTFANARISEASVRQHEDEIRPAYANITGLPASFTPSSHSHDASDIVCLLYTSPSPRD